MLLDSMVGGAVRGPTQTVLIRGSYFSSMDKIIPNVELNEYLLSILQSK